NPRLINFLDAPLADPLTYAALAAVAALTAIAVAWRRRPLLAFWCGFFLVTFSPLFMVDNIAGTLGTNVLLTQERWIYLPSVSVLALAAC
ncbi:MAG: hypothetical protein GWN71_41140, partial [Gammaproteobacteria bacterium]|nr:hypothetical protein [Gemmatimonadota bacterium]NIU79722.1 hypothetical protein [Gammaproteobacteria bacterium]